MYTVLTVALTFKIPVKHTKKYVLINMLSMNQNYELCSSHPNALVTNYAFCLKPVIFPHPSLPTQPCIPPSHLQARGC